MAKTPLHFFPLIISNTVLSDVHRCEVYFFRGWVQRFSSEKSVDLVAGGYIATACEIARKAFYHDNISLDTAIDLGYNYILESPDTGDMLKSNDRLAFVFKKYLQKYPLDKSWVPILLADGSYSIEYYFEFDTGIQHPDLPERNIHLSGKLDLLAEKRIAGGRKVNALVDEKTTKYVKRVEGGGKVLDLAKETESYLSEGQFIGYAWAAKQLGIDIELAFIRRLPILTVHESAFEIEMPITPFMIENWSKSTFNKIYELVEKYKYYKKSGNLFNSFTPVYSLGCNSFNKSCKFKIGCTHQEGEEYLSQKYTQNVWESQRAVDVPMVDYMIREGLMKNENT